MRWKHTNEESLANEWQDCVANISSQVPNGVEDLLVGDIGHSVEGSGSLSLNLRRDAKLL